MPDLAYRNAGCEFSVFTRSGGVEILFVGEEEVEVTESAAPGVTGAWCKRETLRA
ncbi:hypothetical protein [Streptomyces sp. NPDC002851]